MQLPNQAKSVDRSSVPAALGLGSGMSSARIVPASGGIPIYGNWCGPGHGGGPPIDAVDAVCRAHDRCYGRKGYFDCGCNRDLIDAMPGAIARTPSVAGKAAGTVIGAFFSATPCVCEVCLPFVGCFPIPAPFPAACLV